MVNDSRQSPENPHFFQPLLPGFQSHLKIPLKFFSEHIDGKHEGKIVKLISDASRRTWKVKLEAQNLTQGWKEFVEAHDLRIGDVVIFRHEGDMLFHVTALGPNCCEVQYAPSQDEKDSDESGESSRKEIVKTEYDQSSSDLTCFSQTVTASSLKRGGLSVPADFAKRNGLNIGRHEIVLMNEEGKSWESELKTRLSGQVFICGSWKQFCNASKLEVGDYCTFRLLPNIEKPMFQLCSRSNTEREKKILSEEVNIVDKTGQIRFVKLTPTRNSLELGKHHLPVHFTRANELNKPMKIILVDKDKLEWSMKLRVDKRDKTMYIMGGNGWKSFCAANEVDVGESLTLEFVRGGEQPLLKFCSKIVEQPPIRAETRAHKRARVQRWNQEIKPKHDVRERLAAEGEPSRPTRSSNKSTGDPGNLQDTQFCSVSNHVAKVKQSVVETSACIRRLRAELMTAEHNLKASLQEINNIEEAIMGLKKFVK